MVGTSNEHPRASATRSVLRELNASSPEIEASAAITTDGFIIGSVLGDDIDQDRFAAMCASLLALADRAADEISRGELKQVMIEGSAGVMLLVHAGEDAVLALSVKPTASLGRIFIEARKSAANIHNVLAG